jgi:hypothetical protein
MGAICIVFVLWFSFKVFWCDLKQSHFHGCTVCWLVRFFTAVAMVVCLKSVF